MGEVEAQPIRGDQRPGLAHVRAEGLPQRGLQQVRRGVIAAGGVAGGDVRADVHQHASLQGLSSPDAMDAGAPGRQPAHPDDVGDHVLERTKLPRIGNLAA